LDEATITNAANAAAEGVDILSDHYASEEYRKHLAKVYLKKALKAVV
jgi:carbon-monoxide dehydrogenase medium subunit